MRTYGLYDVFVRNATLSKDSVALFDGTSELTFEELHRNSVYAAEFLLSNGVNKGDRVAILTMNRIDFFILLGAVAKIGAILVPLNWRLSPVELTYIVNDCEPKLLFTDETHHEKALQFSKACNLHCLLTDSFTTDSRDQNTPIVEQVDDAALDGSDALCIIYTAAVEGYPRGAVLSHTNIISANLQVISSLSLSESDVNLNMLPLFHITGLNLALAVMQVGGKNVITEKFDESRTVELTSQEKVTVWGSFPPILSRLVELLESAGGDIASLKYIVGLDGPENISRMEEISKAKFWILYGQSETSGFVTFGEAMDRPGSAGRQGGLTTYCLVDEDDNQVPVGDTGEIAVRGPLVFQGYWNLDEVNEKTFRNGWHHTGDLGVQDEEGYLFFKGRKPEKELIKPGGENVYPAEVEAVVLSHHQVKAVCVIGVPDPEFGEGIKAVCELEKNADLTKEQLIEYVGNRIARYKKPKYVEFVEELPKSDGDIDRAKVKAAWG